MVQFMSPSKKTKSRFAQTLINEQTKRGLTDREIAEKHNWLQQTFNRWKMGSLPRDHMYGSIANFLGVTNDKVRELVEEARANSETTPKSFGATSVHGIVADRKEGKYKFPPPQFAGKNIPHGRYAILVDTKIMEPALLAGTKAWLDTTLWPSAGNEVLVHTKSGFAWIGRFVAIADGSADIERGGQTMTIRDVRAIHVIVLSERVAG
jgi:hypothetical protein